MDVFRDPTESWEELGRRPCRRLVRPVAMVAPQP